VSQLQQISDEIQGRAGQMVAAQPGWPCRKGCDECCRRLASPPRISREEWLAVARALDALPAEAGESARQRIRDSASASHPVVCPLLDTACGTCLVYDARPLACRAYGFYAERGLVLGCSLIERMAEQFPDIVWGNHTALEERIEGLGEQAELAVWLAAGA
jgi:Fe-S-cluster containining protein